MSWSAAIGGLITIIVAVLAILKHKRAKRERLAQSEADALKSAMDTPDRSGDKLFLDKPKT